MFKVGDRVRIKLIDSRFDGYEFKITEIIESSSNIYKIKSLNCNLTYFKSEEYIEYDKQYYRKEKLNKILECLK